MQMQTRENPQVSIQPVSDVPISGVFREIGGDPDAKMILAGVVYIYDGPEQSSVPCRRAVKLSTGEESLITFTVNVHWYPDACLVL